MHILAWIAMILISWMIFWWIIGCLLHVTKINVHFGMGYDDFNRFFFFVVWAPAFLPSLPFLYLYDRLVLTRKKVRIPRLSDSPPVDDLPNEAKRKKPD